MVPLTTAANPFAARVLAAHLGAEGIVWELRGNVDGPYPVGPVEVLVAVDDLAVARELVTEQRDLPVADHADAPTGPDRAADAPSPAGRADDRTPLELQLLLVLVLLLALVLLVLTFTGP